MRSKRQEPVAVHEFIMDTMRKKSPKTVEQLVRLVQREYSVPQDEIMRHILQLQSQGKLVFTELPAFFPAKLGKYLFSTNALWYWIVMVLVLATTIAVFVISEKAYPLVYVRYVLGSIFVLGLPGYSLIKALLPTGDLDNVERAALSMGMSLVIVTITKLLLSYTPWSIGITAVTLSLLALTTLFATTAIVREHRAKDKPDAHEESHENFDVSNQTHTLSLLLNKDHN